MVKTKESFRINQKRGGKEGGQFLFFFILTKQGQIFFIYYLFLYPNAINNITHIWQVNGRGKPLAWYVVCKLVERWVCILQWTEIKTYCDAHSHYA